MKRKIFSILFALMLVCSFSLVTAVPAGAVATTVVLGGDVATAVGAQGSSEFHIGSGSWQVNSGTMNVENKMEMHLSPTTAPFSSLGSFTVSQIESISFATKNAGTVDDVDFYFTIYTEWFEGGDSWYGRHLTGEAMYSDTYTPIPNQWNVWTTDADDANKVVFSDSPRTPIGFYGAPTLADIQAGAIDWADYPNSGSTDIIDYSNETVLFITFATGSGWTSTFDGFLDAITIELTTGPSVTIDLEEYYAEVWVDDDAAGDWYALPGNFANIEDGIDNVAEAGTVNVLAGTYEESITIDKANLTLESAVLHGATIDGGTTAAISINAEGVTVDGFEILSSYVSAVYAYEGSNNVKVLNNAVAGGGIYIDFSQGVEILGNRITNAPHIAIFCFGDTDIVIEKNEVIGNVNGILIHQADGATVEYNTVSGSSGDAAMQIVGSKNVVIEFNNITDNAAVGIQHGTDWWSGPITPENNVAHYNNIVGNELGVENWAEAALDATNNWWGDASGPEHITTNPDATGNEVTDNVEFSPWLGASCLTGTAPNIELVAHPWTFIELVTGTDPDPVTLEDDEGNIIATVDISGGDVSSGTIAANSEPGDPTAGLFVGTDTTGVVFLDVKVTGYTEGIAHITVPYPDVAPPDGIVDGTTDPPVYEHTLGLYYWDEAALPAPMWLLAGNNTVHPADGDNFVSGDIPVSALGGTPIGLGGYEALVAIDRILNLSNKSDANNPKPDTVKLTIDTNTAFLGAATIDLIFDPMVVEVIGASGSAFDFLEVNLNYAVIGSDMQTARFLAYQTGAVGVDATVDGGAVVAEVQLKAVGSTMDFSPLRLEVITLKDNNLNRIPRTVGALSFALVGGVGDANRDTYVGAIDLVEIECAILGFPGFSIDTPTMNVDGQDGVDAADCTYLARHRAGVPGHPLPPPGWIPPWAPAP